MRGPCCYQAMSKLIIVKSMVGIILSLSPMSVKSIQMALS